MTDTDHSVLLSGYVRDLFADEGEVLEELRYETSREDLPEIYISAEEGKLLQVLLAAVGARRVLEIGTLGGYSALWMARALPSDGTLITLEIDPDRAEFARGFIEKAGMADVVEVRVGDARDVMAAMVEDGVEPFDAVFIDADKEPLLEYLDLSLELVGPGGLILTDNAFRSGHVLDEEPAEDARAVIAYNERVASDPRLVSTIIPVRDGLAVSVVKG
ncbi:MAG: O-methyltransferase [Longimicrobiales bacterium]